MASDLTEKILEYLSTHDEVDSLTLATIFGQDHQKIVGAIKSLQAVADLINVEAKSQKEWTLSEEGEHILKHGSHEAAVYNSISDTKETLQSDIIEKVPYGKVGISKALAAGWIALDKQADKTLLKKKVNCITDIVRIHLKQVQALSDDLKKEYKKRKLIKESILKSSILRKGANFTTKLEKSEADLSAEMLLNNGWKNKHFKPYNMDALGANLDVGYMHPLMKVRAEFRKIFLEMGFEEMPTNNYVESSFWNFDALFVPQQHPARDAQDTFFVSDPAMTSKLPDLYMEKVKEVHTKGAYGSKGYQCDWKIEEAKKNVLRTHTTAVSARMLHRLMSMGEFKPVRFFSIDRVFRNENLDATHLAEFHQVEGVVADYNLSLGDLIGTLNVFFKKLGITELEFKPAYNPYTEPSMEIFCFHNGLGKWIEIGNSGCFRPEMLLPMGLPENVNVIAWGLSLERPTMIKYGLNNIRDLVGPKVDLQMVRDNPLCRFNKRGAPKRVSDAQYHPFHEPLEQKNGCNNLGDLVIFCDPLHPPYYLTPLLELLNQIYSLTVLTHIHSSVNKLPIVASLLLEDFSNNLLRITEMKNSKSGLEPFTFRLIWKNMDFHCPISMHVKEMRKIVGGINVARCINRLIESKTPECLRYESLGAEYACQIDSILDDLEWSQKSNIYKLKHESQRNEKKSHAKTSKYWMGDKMSLIDLFVQ